MKWTVDCSHFPVGTAPCARPSPATCDAAAACGPPTLEGLMLGYGAADLAAVSRGCQVIAEILAGLPGTGGAASR